MHICASRASNNNSLTVAHDAIVVRRAGARVARRERLASLQRLRAPPHERTEPEELLKAASKAAREWEVGGVGGGDYY